MPTANTTILDRLAEGASDDSWILFPVESDHRTRLSDIWRQSRQAADWFSARTTAGDTVVAELSATSNAVIALIGAWRAGLKVASIPVSEARTPIKERRSRVQHLVELVGANLMLASPTTVADYEGLCPSVHSFNDTSGSAIPGRRTERGKLIQFTSGSTGEPKAVELSLEAVAASVDATLPMIALGGREVSVSWLPLSHDFGLVGTLLTPWTASSPAHGSCSVGMVFLPTSDFVIRPGRWLKLCTELRATVTYSPDYGLQLGTRLLRRSRKINLSTLRLLVCGGEMVQATTLRNFEAAAAMVGFDPVGLSPGYGMAEAVLTVTIVPAETKWSSRTVDTGALADRRWVPSETGVEVVNCGHPIQSVEIADSDQRPDTGLETDAGCEKAGDQNHPSCGGVSRLKIRGPSLFQGYVGGEHRHPEDWFDTTDLGHVDDSGVYVTGRIDDVIVVAGRNFYAAMLERTVARHPEVRLNCLVAIPDGAGGYAIMAEPRRQKDRNELRAIALGLRSELARRAIAPSAVGFVGRGALPRTPSGKIRRHLLAEEYRADELEAVHIERFRPNR